MNASVITRLFRWTALMTLFTALPAGYALAQPRLVLRALKPNSPAYYYYHLYFTASCGDSIIYDLDKHQLILEEDGGRIDTNVYAIDQLASPVRNSCYDVALAVDNSSAMAGTFLAAATSAGRAFVDSMSLECQSAAVMSFADEITIQEYLTNDHAALSAAFDRMIASGRRHLYDAVRAGMIEFETNGTRAVRAIVLLTAGEDDGSSTSLDEIVSLAQLRAVRVIVVALAFSPSGDLKRLAEESGGVLVPAHATDSLAGQFRKLEGFVQREYDEHRIVRRTQSVIMEGKRISLRLEACADSVWATRCFFCDIPVDARPTPLALDFRLGPTYPHPLRSGDLATVRYVTPPSWSGPVTVHLYDALGRRVRTLCDGPDGSGSHAIQWSTKGLPPGAYYLHLVAGPRSMTSGVILLR